MDDNSTTGDHEGRSLNEKLTMCERYRGRMMHAARDYTVIFEDAQDAVQEAMLKVARRLDIDWSRVEGLLIVATRNACIDLFRASTRRQWRDLTYGYGVIPSIDPMQDVLDRAEADWASTHLQLVGAREQRILRRLADGHRLADIAADEGLKYSTAHSCVTRARRTLLTALGEAM